MVRNYLVLLGFLGLLDGAIHVPTAAADDESPVCCRSFGTCPTRPCEKCECQVFAFAIAAWSV
jgi:hypothetical protein